MRRQIPFYRKILPYFLAIITRKDRYLPDIVWSSKSWTHNIFRAYEMFFWRRHGIRAEMSVTVDRYGKTVYACHSFESSIALIEHAIRSVLDFKFTPIKIVVPVFSVPQGFPQFSSPYMFAIAVDTPTQGDFGTGAAQNWSHVCTGSNLILYTTTASNSTSDGVTSVTYGIAGLTRAGYLSSTSGTTYLYRLVAPATGSNTVALVRSAGYLSNCSVSYSGAAQTGQPDATATTNSGNGVSTLTGTITVVAANSWLILASNTTGAELTAGTGTTRRQTGGDVEGSCFDSNGGVAAGSQSLIINSSGTPNLALVMESFSPFGVADLTVSVNDAITLAESILRILISFITVSDAATLSESITVQSSLGDIGVSDAITISESISISFIMLVSVSDAITVSESASVFVPSEFEYITDTITITETVTIRVYPDPISGIAIMRSSENYYPLGMGNE